MKVLLVNYTDAGGGAAIASLRLVTALNEHGIKAGLGVLKKQTSAAFVFELPKKKRLFGGLFSSKYVDFIIKKIKEQFYKFIFKTSNGIKHSTNFHSKIDVKWINESDYAVVNLHWICDLISNKDIAKIKKPIVWTMHDSWPCCGAEHHPNVLENDTRWQEGYFRNNKPKSTKGIDLCRKVWKQKKKYLGNKDIVFTAPSKWEHDVLKSSVLFGHCECKVIPNIIDHSVFYPKDKNSVKKLFGIPDDKIILGFGAAYDIDNPKSMKGSYYLLEALSKLKNPEKYFLVIFGPAGDSFTSKVSIPFFASGYISNPNILACLYSACDCVINSSLIENLPTTCLESLCCGVPVVAFDVGGTSDIVVHKQTGFLATPYKAEELAEGVEWCTQNLTVLSKNCTEKSLHDFDEERTVQKYIDLYSSLMHN